MVKALSALVPQLGHALAPGTEVVLHELARLPNSIIAIGNPLTGRSIGDPPTDLLLQDVRESRFEDRFQYDALAMTGRAFRSSTVYVRDSSGAPIAALCLNRDLSGLTRARDFVQAELTGAGPSIEGNRSESGLQQRTEAFPRGIRELADLLLERAITGVGVPTSLMTKRHMLLVVEYLERHGFFLIRDAIELAAAALGVTRYTIYNYLREVGGGSRMRGRSELRAEIGEK
ncbi:MAG: transcriptional regulator [Candidatus Limnocylindrales bacterium]